MVLAIIAGLIGAAINVIGDYFDKRKLEKHSLFK